MDKSKIITAVEMILEAIGEDPQRPGIKDTPQRVANMYEEIFSGIAKDASKEIQVFLPDEYDELLLVKDIPFYSVCEHHFMPFFGKVHVAYIPKHGRITGLSKLGRVVEVLSRKLQLQERLTTNIADILMKSLNPHGVMVVIEAEHLCMTMRGVKKPGALTVTSAVRGQFTKSATRAEAMALIRG